MKILNFICFILLCNYSYHVFAQQKLGSYQIFRDAITASGHSSGGTMAVQLHVAFSSIFSGAATVSGPAYYCAGTGGLTSALSSCMTSSGMILLGSSVETIVSNYNNFVSSGKVDSADNLRNDRVYIFHGTLDSTVSLANVRKNEEFYGRFLSESNIMTKYDMSAPHGFLTNNYGGGCSSTSITNYLNNCNYNQAFDILRHLNGLTSSEPDKSATYKGSLIEFDQSEFFPSGTSSSITMDTSGYVYVPQQCKDGKACRLHVALHGCSQSKSKIGDVFAKNAGFNQVGDDNDIIIIYPQAKANILTNPNGCWDWWGYTNSDYANKQGQQMRAIKAMVDRVSSGGLVDGGGPDPSVTGATTVKPTVTTTISPTGSATGAATTTTSKPCLRRKGKKGRGKKKVKAL